VRPELALAYVDGIAGACRPLAVVSKLLYDNSMEVSGELGDFPGDIGEWCDGLCHMFDDTAHSLERDCDAMRGFITGAWTDAQLWTSHALVRWRWQEFPVKIGWFRDAQNDPAADAEMRHQADVAWFRASALYTELHDFDGWLMALYSWRRRQGA